MWFCYAVWIVFLKCVCIMDAVTICGKFHGFLKDLSRSSSPFCNSAVIFSNTHSCSYQLQNNDSNFCQVAVAKSGPETFGVHRCHADDACGVYVMTFVSDYHKKEFNPETILSINLVNSHARDVRFKYTLYGVVEAHNRFVNVSLHGPVSEDLPFYFDCNMKPVKQNYTLLLEYSVDGQSGGFLLKIPRAEYRTDTTPQWDELESGAVPFYVHVFSNEDKILSSRQPNLLVTLQAYPESDLTEWQKPLYNVVLQERTSFSDEWQLREQVIVNTSDPGSYINRWRNLYTVRMSTSLQIGDYKLIVQPLCADPHMAQLLSNYTNYLIFPIKVNNIPVSRALGIFLSIAFVVLVVSFGLYILFLQKLMNQPWNYSSIQRKTLFLIHKDKSREHSDSAIALKEFLETHLNLTVWMDVEAVNETKHQDPLSWTIQCLEKADHVAVVIPPKDSTNSDYEPIHPLSFELGCEHLISIRRAINKKLSFKEFCTVIQLPDSDISQLPKVVAPYPKFQFPGKASEFEYYIWRCELQLSQLDFCFNLGLLSLLTRKRNEKYSAKYQAIVDKISSQRSTQQQFWVYEVPQINPGEPEVHEDFEKHQLENDFPNLQLFGKTEDKTCDSDNDMDNAACNSLYQNLRLM